MDSVNSIEVLINPGSLPGSPEAYLPSLSPLLGQQSYLGETWEGGFKPGQVSKAHVLDVGSRTAGGKTYFTYYILTNTVDGNEGGRHHLFTVTSSNGKVYTAHAQAGDKRWFFGMEKELREASESFSVA